MIEPFFSLLVNIPQRVLKHHTLSAKSMPCEGPAFLAWNNSWDIRIATQAQLKQHITTTTEQMQSSHDHA